jgi:hypothetical protein
MEGIIAKRKDSIYRPGKWIPDDFPIIFRAADIALNYFALTSPIATGVFIGRVRRVERTPNTD